MVRKIDILKAENDSLITAECENKKTHLLKKEAIRKETSMKNYIQRKIKMIKKLNVEEK